MIVLWRITTRCNLACPFCAYDRSLRFPRVDVPMAEVERFGALLGQWRAATGERVLLSWLGGEPLLWPGLLPLSRRLRERHGLTVSATSNGTRLADPAVRAQVLEGLDELTLSIDGDAAWHDALRGWRGGTRRLEAATRALAQARAAAGAGPRLRANVVLMRDNLPQFADLCERLADWGMDEITFNQLGGRDRPEFFPRHALRPADAMALRAMLPGLRASLAARGVRLCADARYLDRIAASARGVRLPVADCSRGETLLFIDEAGRVAPCSFTLDEYAVPLSQLDTPQSLDALPHRFRAERDRATAPACGDCPSTRVFAKFG